MTTISELQIQLQTLTKSKVKQTDIAKALNVGRANISLRIKNNSQLNFDEIKKIEKYFCISIHNQNINSLERHFNPDIKINQKELGERFSDIQTKNNLSNRQFAGFLDIQEQELKEILSGQILPNWNIITNLKQNFKVSVDWLFYGD